MKIMVFTEGTLTMACCARGVSREERVRQVIENLPEVDDFSTYLPVDNSVEKLKVWSQQGVEICYLTSRRNVKEIQQVENTLAKYNFPKGTVYYRKDDESYSDVAERVMPDILIEDDCESIGGEIEMTYPHINSGKKHLIKSIVVREFEGINHLPDDIDQLKMFFVNRSENLARSFLGKVVSVVIDRPLGSEHPKYKFKYPVNYGFIKCIISSDHEELDAYFLGVNTPLKEGLGICIAYIHRKNDDDDKLVVVPIGVDLSDEEIIDQVKFQEQWFNSEVVKK